MMTVFEQIPDLFVEIYDPQFQQWAREFRARGPFAAIVFNRPPGHEIERDEHGEPVWWGCWLEAEIDRTLIGGPRVVIKPRTGHDREMIERHVKEMAPFWLH